MTNRGAMTLTNVVQEYLAKPFLIDGLKFDLRLYVLVLSVDPLRVFVYDDGLVRMSTAPYKEPTERNLGKLYMHLTNYSVNKHSDEFAQTDDAGTVSRPTPLFSAACLSELGCKAPGRACVVV